MYTIQNPFAYFNSPTNSKPIGLGHIYIGLKNTDPTLPENQIDVFAVQPCDCEEPYLQIQQPIQLLAGGIPSYNGAPIQIVTGEVEYSISVKYANGNHAYYTPLVTGNIDVAGDLSYVNGIKNLTAISNATLNVVGFYENTTVGGGQFIYDATRSVADHNGGTVIAAAAIAAWDGSRSDLDSLTSWVGTGVGCFVRSNTGLDRRAEWFGIEGNYDATLNPTVNDTRQLQALFDSVDDNCSIYGYGDMRLVRDGASVRTIDGVSSYLCVITQKHNVTIKSGFKVHQKHNSTLDCVGVAFDGCDDMNLEMPVFDGGFKYTSSTVTNYKQQLLHIFRFKNLSGGFKVKNSSNVGFLITNDYASPHTESQRNNSVLHTVISENCFQNTTFGSGVCGVTIGSFVCLNPIGAAIKASSRFTGTSVGFNGFRIDNFQCLFDETYENPLNDTGTAPNSYLSILDNVSTVEHFSIGYAYIDFTNTTIPSIGVKQHTRTSSLSTKPCGPCSIETLEIKNQRVTNSVAYLADNEAVAIKIGKLILDGASTAVNISNGVTSATVQPKNSKYLDVGEIVSTGGNDKALISIADFSASFVRIGRILQRGIVGTQQSINIDNNCDIDTVDLPSIDVTANVRIRGKFDSLLIAGKVDSASQTSNPVLIDTIAKSGELTYSLNVRADGDSTRRVFINNVTKLKLLDYSLAGTPQGIALGVVDETMVSDIEPSISDLIALMPITMDDALTGSVNGVISYTGSPSNVLVGSSGLMFRSKLADGVGSIYIKILSVELGDRKLGWRKLAVVP